MIHLTKEQLQGALVHSMTFDSWKTSVQPNVLSAMNLHYVLAHGRPQLLPYDILRLRNLSIPGQGNYAAADSYLDSLALYRMRRGQSAVASVITMVLGVGVVFKHTELEDSLRGTGMYGMDEEHCV